MPFFKRNFKVNLELYTDSSRGAARITEDDIFAAQRGIKDSRPTVFKSVLKKTRRVRVTIKTVHIFFVFSLKLIKINYNRSINWELRRSIHCSPRSNICLRMNLSAVRVSYTLIDK